MNTVTIDSSALAAHNDFHLPLPTPPSISFATHNVRSFTNVAKQTSIIELYSSLNLDIIGLQETNFSSFSTHALTAHFPLNLLVFLVHSLILNHRDLVSVWVFYFVRT